MSFEENESPYATEKIFSEPALSKASP